MSKRYTYYGSLSGAVPSCYYQFDGVDEEILVGATSSFNFIHTTGVFSIAYYMKIPDHTANIIGRIMGNNGTSTNKIGCQMEWRNNTGQKRLRMRITKGSSPVVIVSETLDNAITDNDWHLIIVSGDGTNVWFTIDDTKQMGSSSMGSKSGSNATHILGFATINDSAAWMNVGLDEISFYTTNLSDANKTAIFNATRIAPDYSAIPTLVNHYKMGEDDTWDGSNWTVIDSVSAVNGASVNMEEVDRICS